MLLEYTLSAMIMSIGLLIIFAIALIKLPFAIIKDTIN
jgi:hypothetical protein